MKNHVGQRLARLAHFTRLEYTLTLNGVGVATVQFADLLPGSLLVEDNRLEIYRKSFGGLKYLDGQAVFLLRDWETLYTSRRQRQTTLVGYSANEITDRRIVAYNEANTLATNTGSADDVMKDFVSQNLGGAVTDNNRDISDYVTVQAAAGDGPTVTKQGSYRNLFTLLQEIAQAADDAGPPVFFDIVKSSATGLEFRTYSTVRGVSRTRSDAAPLVLSLSNGSLIDVKREYLSRDEENVIYLKPDETETASSAARLIASSLNRREGLTTAGTDSAARTAEAEAAVRKGRIREVYTAKVQNTNNIQYGRNFGFGDRLPVIFDRRQGIARLESVTVTAENFTEDIRVGLRIEILRSPEEEQ